jgi:sulfonate transport system ATP-binding protein
MLVLDRVGKTYPNGVRALDGISLEVAPGEILVVIGGSGCGKSTMLRAISGLDTPTQGKVVLDDMVITAPHEQIGIIFQEPRLLPWLRVADNVGFGLEQYPKAERKTRVTRALERVGLTDKAKVWPRELSGGQAQRVAIAAHWCRGRRCSCSMSRSPRSTPSPAPTCRITCSTSGPT